MFIRIFQGHSRLAVPGGLFQAVPSCSGAVMGVPGCFGLIQTVLNCIYIIYRPFRTNPRCSGSSIPIRVSMFLFRIPYSNPGLSVAIPVPYSGSISSFSMYRRVGDIKIAES